MNYSTTMSDTIQRSKCLEDSKAFDFRAFGRKVGSKNAFPHSKEYREKKRQERLAYLASHPRILNGANNPNWRGGIVPKSKLRLTTWKWKVICKRIIERDKKCCICGTCENLLVHHKIPWRFSQDDSDENLIAVCKFHHAKLDIQAYDAVLEAAIIKKCHKCRPNDVASCGDRCCPLWHFRPFQHRKEKNVSQ